MPLPIPNENESKDSFMKRCFTDNSMKSEFSELDQRYSMCSNIYDGKTPGNKKSRFESKEMMLGDYVSWSSGGSTLYGRITRRITDGRLQVPDSAFYIDGTDKDPAYLIRVYNRQENGGFTESNTIVGHTEDSLTRVPNLEDVKSDMDADESDNDAGIQININQDDDDEEDESLDDENEGENTEPMDEDMQYLTDRMRFEAESADDDEGSAIDYGDYVRFEVAGNMYRGRVVDMCKTGGALISTAGTKLDGNDEDPALLIRLYNEGDNGYEESDIKVVHRRSAVTKITNLRGYGDDLSKKMVGHKETKLFSFKVQETKEVNIDGINYGIVRGYASTYGNVDRGNDRVVAGAFTNSLNRYRENNRPIKMYYQHDSKEIIGGFPIDKIKDDGNGLYVEGQINLDVQRGREVYALAKQGIIQDFSIGYTVEDYDLNKGIRELKELELWEISMVGEPMNPEARIMSVKAKMETPDLPLVAEKNYPWDADGAISRIRKFTNSENKPSDSYKRAFLWYNTKAPGDFQSYQFPYADVVNGKLVAIPNALDAVNAAINNSSFNNLTLNDKDKKMIQKSLDRYNAEMAFKYVMPVDPDIDLIYTSAPDISSKAVVPFKDLPLAADKDHPWDNEAAIARIKDFTNSQDKPTDSYRHAFMWFDHKAPDNFGSYKLPFADVVDGKLVAIPAALSAIKAAVNGARGGVDIPEKDKEKVLKLVDKYNAKMTSKFATLADINLNAILDKVISIKSVTEYQDDMPFALLDYKWEPDAALKRVKTFTKATKKPNKAFAKAFMWFDDSKSDDFNSYKLPFVDVVDGKLTIVPQALDAIKANIQNNSNDITAIPAKDLETIKQNLGQYYIDMNFKLVKPVDPNAKLTYASVSGPSATPPSKQFSYEDIKNIKTKRDLEKVLRESGLFTKKAAIYLSSQFNEGRSDSVEKIEINEIKHLINYLNGVRNGCENRSELPSS